MSQSIAAKLALAAAFAVAAAAPAAQAGVYSPVTVDTADYAYSSILPGLAALAPSGPVATLNPWALPSDVGVTVTPPGTTPDGVGESYQITVPFWTTGNHPVGFEVAAVASAPARQDEQPGRDVSQPMTFNPVALNEPVKLAMLGVGFLGIAALVRRPQSSSRPGLGAPNPGLS